MIRVILAGVLSVLLFSLIHFLGKKKKPFKRAFLSAATGPVILIILNFLQSVTGVLVSLSELSFVVSTALGIPGVSLLVIAENLFA